MQEAVGDRMGMLFYSDHGKSEEERRIKEQDVWKQVPKYEAFTG
jgi:hypothetical protein